MKIVSAAVFALVLAVSAATAQTTSTWEYRLAGTGNTSNYGRLEARSSSTGTWGTVCDDLFDRNDALVACRSLGVNTTRVSFSTASYNMQGSSSQPTVMDNLRCLGNETSLDQCSYVGQSSEDCSHYEDVVLTCRDPNEVFEYRLAGENATSTSGRLEVRNGTANGTFGEWGTVCNDFFGYREAAVACKALGLNTSHPYYSTVSTDFRGNTSQPTLLDDLVCQGSESALDECGFTPAERENCQYWDAIHLACPTDSATWEYRLAGTGSTSRIGRLEARPNSDIAWGNVCNDWFDNLDAAVACRSLGLNFSVASWSSSVSSMQGLSTQGVALGSLNCNGNETSLDQCGVAYSRNDCAYYEAVVVTCRDPNEVWEYRLAGGNATTTSGRLETRGHVDSNWTSWGTVCQDLFDGNDARVACRSLGLNTSHPSYWTAPTWMQGNSTQPTNMDDLSCTGTESSLDYCPFVGSVGENCYHNEDIVVSCPTASSTWEYRLGFGTTRGRLEARSSPTAPWGTVCDDYRTFGREEARVACRALGLNTSRPSFSIATSSTQGSSTQPIVLANLHCVGNETSPDKCGVLSGSRSCSHWDDAILRCPNASEAWQFRLAGSFNTSTYGRLEAREGASSTWGTVCDDSFGVTDARVACRALGLNDAFASYSTATTSQQGASTQPIVMDDVFCTGSELSLDECTFTDQFGENCRHYEDVVLNCPAAANWDYRLAGSFASYTSGRLEVRLAGGTWGTVCDDLFGLADARVACRSLGLGTEGVTYSTAQSYQQGSFWQPIAMDNLGCTGNESELANCSFTGSSGHNCGHWEDVILNCGAPTSCPVIQTSSSLNMNNCSCDVALCDCMGGTPVAAAWWSTTMQCHLGSTITCTNRTQCSEAYYRCMQREATSGVWSHCRSAALSTEVEILSHSLEEDQTNTALVNECRNKYCGAQRNRTCTEAGATLPTFEEETAMCIAAAANLTVRNVCNCNGRGQSYIAPWLPAGCACSCNWPYTGSNCSDCARVSDYFDSATQTCRSCTANYVTQTYLAASNVSVHVPMYLNEACVRNRRVFYYGGSPTSRWRASYAALTTTGFIVNAHCTNRYSNRYFPFTNSMYLTGSSSWYYLGRIMCAPPLRLSVRAPRRVHLHLLDSTDSAIGEMLVMASTLLANGTSVTFSTYQMWYVSERRTVNSTAELTSYLSTLMATRYTFYTTISTCALFPTSANVTLPRMIEGTGAEAVIGFGSTSTSCGWVQSQLADVARMGVQLGWVGTADTTGLWYVTALTYTSSDFWALEEQVNAFFSARGAATCEDTISFPSMVRAMTRRDVQIAGSCNVTSCCVGSSCSRFAINRGGAGCTTPLVWRQPMAIDERAVTVTTANGEQNDTTTVGANRYWSGGVYAYRERTWNWRRVEGFFQSRGNYTNRVRVYRYRSSIECCKLVGVTFDNKVAGELTSQQCFTSTRRWSSLQLTIPTLTSERFAQPVRTVAVQCGVRPVSIADAVDGGSFRIPAAAFGSNGSSAVRNNGAASTTTHSPSNLGRISRYVTAMTASAGTQSTGQALRRVRVALETAGLRSTIASHRRPCRSTDIPGPSGDCEYVWSASAAEAGPFLESAGFELVTNSSSWSLESVMRGDIVVFPAQAADGTPAANGTIAVVSSPTSMTGLIGDVQHGFYPYATGSPASVGSSATPSVYRLAALVEEAPMGSETLVPLVAAKEATQDKQAYCDAFFAWDQTLKAEIFAEAVDFMNSHYRCPALLDRFTRPRQFWTAWDMTGLNVSFDVQCFAVSQWWIRGRPRQHGTGARCCYDVNNTYIPSWPSRVTFSESDQWIWSDAAERDAESVCCGDGVHTADTQACLAFRARRPALRPTNAPFVAPMRWWPRRRGAGGWGDPHCNTYDGVSFECNFHGEAVWTACDSWKVHAVAEPVGTTSAATVITKFAVQYNETTAIGELLTTTDTNTYYQITLNGDEITSDVTEGDLTVAFDNDTITFTSAGGDEVTAVFSRRLITLSTVPAEDCRGRATGLSGNFDGNSTNDLRVPGTDRYLTDNATSATIYRDYVIPHLVTDLADSLFQGMQITTNASYTPAFIDSIDLTNCPSACQGNRACCFDASVGGAEFAAEFVAAQSALAQQQQGAIGFNENFPPVFTVATDVISLGSGNGSTSVVTLASYIAFDADTVTSITCDLCGMTGVVCSRGNVGTANASLVIVGPMPTQEGSISCTATDANGGVGRATTLVVSSSSFGGTGYVQSTTAPPMTTDPPQIVPDPTPTPPLEGMDNSSASPVTALLAVVMSAVATLAMVL